MATHQRINAFVVQANTANMRETTMTATGRAATQQANTVTSASLRGYWPPFTRLDTRAASRVTIVRGEGSTVWDDTGRPYLDATASLWYANIGHGRREIADAVAEQITRLEAYSNFGAFTTEPTERLTERVAARLPMDDPLVFLTSQGSDSVDTATKLARRHHHLKGDPHRTIVISREGAYHGMHGIGTSLAGIPANRDGYSLVDSGEAYRTTANDLVATEQLLTEVGPERIAAIIAEPVIGAGGVIPPEPGFLQGLRSLCDEHGILMIADEVITGFGRLGTWFGAERFGITPDLVTMGKGITSGYLPLGGVGVARNVWEPFAASGEVVRHGYTYSGHATSCAAANANLDIIEREQLVERVADIEPRFAATLTPLADHELVAEVRQIGLLCAIQLVGGDAALTDRAVNAARDHGVLTRALAGGALQVSPPFVVTDAEIAAIATGLSAALDDVLER